MIKKISMLLLAARVISAAEPLVLGEEHLDDQLAGTRILDPLLLAKERERMRVTHLQRSVIDGRNSIVKKLLSQITIEEVRAVPFPGGENIMHFAVKNGDPDLIDLLLRSDAGYQQMMDERNHRNETPTDILPQLSVTSQLPSVADAAVELSAPTASVSAFAASAVEGYLDLLLSRAIMADNVDAVTAALHRYVKSIDPLKIVLGPTGNSPLHLAILHGAEKVFVHLLELEQELNLAKENSGGKTRLRFD